MEKKSWCIPRVDGPFVDRMNDVLELYERPYDPSEPVVGVDEKGKQLLEDLRKPLPLASRYGHRFDSEYKRHGTRNLFVGVEPKAGQRYVVITLRKTKKDFAEYLAGLVARYPDAVKVHVILDNYKTHSFSLLLRKGDQSACILPVKLSLKKEINGLND